MKVLRFAYAIIMLPLIVLLTACNFTDENNVGASGTNATFTGVIEKIDDQTALVIIEEGEILKSGHEVEVNLSVSEHIPFHIGDKIRVGYDGEVIHWELTHLTSN